MLTRKQHELLSFINTKLEATGISPSLEAVRSAVSSLMPWPPKNLPPSALKTPMLGRPLCSSLHKPSTVGSDARNTDSRGIVAVSLAFLSRRLCCSTASRCSSLLAFSNTA
mgnify:CR=1 FL=1